MFSSGGLHSILGMIYMARVITAIIPFLVQIAMQISNAFVNHDMSSSRIASSSSFLKGRLKSSVPIESLWLVMI